MAPARKLAIRALFHRDGSRAGQRTVGNEDGERELFPKTQQGQQLAGLLDRERRYRDFPEVICQLRSCRCRLRKEMRRPGDVLQFRTLQKMPDHHFEAPHRFIADQEIDVVEQHQRIFFLGSSNQHRLDPIDDL